MATSAPAAPSSPASTSSTGAGSSAPAAPSSPGAAGASSPAPRSESDFLAGVPGPADSLFAGETPEQAAEGEGAAAETPEAPGAIFDAVAESLPEEVRGRFKTELDRLKSAAGRVQAISEQHRTLSQTAQHNTQAGQGWMQLFGLAVQQMRAQGLDTSQLEGYAGGRVPEGDGQISDDGGSGDFDYNAVAREAISGGLDDAYWGHYDAAISTAERNLRLAQDAVDAQHPDGPEQLKAALAQRRQIDQIHARRVAATAAHPAKAVFDALSRRIAELEAGRSEESEGQQSIEAVRAALKEHVHSTDDLGKHIWRDGGKFPFYTADGKALAPLGQKMIQAMHEFWEETGSDPADPRAFARAFHAVRGELGLDVPAQAAPQGAADGRRAGGDPTLPGGASIPVAAVGRSPFATPESQRQAILERNRRTMRATS